MNSIRTRIEEKNLTEHQGTIGSGKIRLGTLYYRVAEGSGTYEYYRIAEKFTLWNAGVSSSWKIHYTNAGVLLSSGIIHYTECRGTIN